MNQQDPATLHALLPYLPFVIVLLLLFRRTQRSSVLRPGRLWIGPVIFLVTAPFYVWMAMRSGPMLHTMDWLIIAASAVVGAAVGASRAHFLHLTRRPDDGQFETRLSAWGLVFILVWIAGRQLLRQSGWVNANAPFGVYADSGMALGFGLLMANAIVLTRRCQALMADNKPLTANVSGGAA